MVEQVTQGIKIGVKTKYNGTSYRNYHLYHIFSYFVTITNNSNHKVQLKSRRWTILDSQNKTENVEGEGVVGETPILRPKETYSYQSGCFLESTIGAMKGHYIMVNLDSNLEFKVIIPTFQLNAPALSN